MRVAHLVLAHRFPDQANAFARQLAGPGSDVYMHVDAKVGAAEFRRFGAGAPVRVLGERFAVNWGDFDIVLAEIASLRAILATGVPYDFVALHSGQDLLVRPGLMEHLEANKGRSFMHARRHEAGDPANFFRDVDWPAGLRRQTAPLHPYRLLRTALRRLYALGVNPLPSPYPLPDGWVFHRGSQWFCATAEAVAWMLAYGDAHPEYADAFRRSLVPDMTYFQTLLMNSPFAASCAGENLTYLEFGRTYATSNNPVTLTMKDVPAIEASGRFFARKFDPSVDEGVMRYFRAKAGA